MTSRMCERWSLPAPGDEEAGTAGGATTHMIAWHSCARCEKATAPRKHEQMSCGVPRSHGQQALTGPSASRDEIIYQGNLLVHLPVITPTMIWHPCWISEASHASPLQSVSPTRMSARTPATAHGCNDGASSRQRRERRKGRRCLRHTVATSTHRSPNGAKPCQAPPPLRAASETLAERRRSTEMSPSKKRWRHQCSRTSEPQQPHIGRCWIRVATTL